MILSSRAMVCSCPGEACDTSIRNCFIFPFFCGLFFVCVWPLSLSFLSVSLSLSGLCLVIVCVWEPALDLLICEGVLLSIEIFSFPSLQCWRSPNDSRDVFFFSFVAPICYNQARIKTLDSRVRDKVLTTWQQCQTEFPHPLLQQQTCTLFLFRLTITILHGPSETTIPCKFLYMFLNLSLNLSAVQLCQWCGVSQWSGHPPSLTAFVPLCLPCY